MPTALGAFLTVVTLALGITLIEGQEIRGGNLTLVGLWTLAALTLLWVLYASVMHFRRPAKATDAQQQITSHSQSGGITAGTVNITNQSPQPTLHVRRVSANEKEKTVFTTPNTRRTLPRLMRFSHSRCVPTHRLFRKCRCFLREGAQQ